MNQAEMMAEIERLKRDNARLKDEAKAKVSFKVSDKGAVSAYGLGRFPVTLYRGQWEALIENMPKLKAFIEANAGSLSVKGAS